MSQKNDKNNLGDRNIPPNFETMKTILIDYPIETYFTVGNDLPDFNYGCPIRTEILHRELEKMDQDPLNHKISDYHNISDYLVEDIEVVTDIKTNEVFEVWIVGS